MAVFDLSGWDSEQDSDTESRLLDSPKCGNQCDCGHRLRTDWCDLTYSQRHSDETQVFKVMEGNGEQVKAISNWVRQTGDT